MLCAEWEDTNETVQASDQAVYHLGFDPDRGTIDPDRALCIYLKMCIRDRHNSQWYYN